MAERINTDLCVIGGGSAGLSVAASAAALGADVTLVEKGAMGGECLNTGCIPSKSLIAAAHAAQAMRSATRFGVRRETPQVDFAAVRAHVRAVIEDISAVDSRQRFGALRVRVIEGEGRFINRAEIEAGGRVIAARRFVIATGSAPAAPAIPGLETIPFLTNESVFDLGMLPARLLIIGAGPTGLELAQAFQALGSQVTVLDAGHALAGVDREIADVVLIRAAKSGIVIREGVRITRAEPAGSGARLIVSGAPEEVFEGTHVLVAAGRRPRLEGLNLDAAGVAWTKQGITLDSQLRSVSNRRVYGAGDITGGPKLTGMAGYQAGLIVRQTLFRLRIKYQPALVPRAIFTDPEIALVGLSEEEARGAHGAVDVMRWPYSENDRARTERSEDGLIKVVTRKNGRILGAAIAGKNAGELVAFWSLALSRGMKVQDLRDVPMAYPTLSEISRRAALNWYLPKLGGPGLRRLLGFLRSFG